MPPLSGSDHDMECYENEISNFELSNGLKKPKLSDSSLQRITPDSGIALSYQSSISSVDSLSPPIEKASGEEIAKGFHNFEGNTGQDIEENSKNPRIMSELGSNVATLALTSVANEMNVNPTLTSNYPAHSSPVHSPNTQSFQKGTIPLSHAPSMDPRVHSQPLLHVHSSPMAGTSPGIMHSSPAMLHSPAHNTAFPFNASAHLAHPYTQPSPPPFHSYSMSPGHPHHATMFAPGISSPNPYSHTTRPIAPYNNGPGVFPHAPMPSQQPFRHYPQPNTVQRNCHYPISSYSSIQSPIISNPISIHQKHNPLSSKQNTFVPSSNTMTISKSSQNVGNMTNNKSVPPTSTPSEKKEKLSEDIKQSDEVPSPPKSSNEEKTEVSSNSVIVKSEALISRTMQPSGDEIEEKSTEESKTSASTNQSEGEQQLYSKR